MRNIYIYIYIYTGIYVYKVGKLFFLQCKTGKKKINFINLFGYKVKKIIF